MLRHGDVAAAGLYIITILIHGAVEFILIDETDFVENTKDCDRTAHKQQDNLPARVCRELVHYNTSGKQITENNAALVGWHSKQLTVEHERRGQVQEVEY